jgi:hydroxymethylpyrimidine/phosphomethylpyrimidine kinase
MSEKRPFVLTIAGFDPTGGAGVLADIKTFEQHRVYGLAINTANTIQTENTFYKTDWTPIAFILESLENILDNYKIVAIKIGIVPSLFYLKKIVFKIKKQAPETKIIWDPILKSSTEFDFLKLSDQSEFITVLKQIDLITPNFNEIKTFNVKEKNPVTIAFFFSKYCSILLKGGHNQQEIGVDYLFTEKEILKLTPIKTLLSEKHGSGCVLSSAIVSNIALGQNLITACENAKKYIEHFLESNPTKLGYHYV